MAKKQTRRSVSLNRTKYELLKQLSAVHGKSMSQLVEGWTRDAYSAYRASENVPRDQDRHP